MERDHVAWNGWTTTAHGHGIHVTSDRLESGDVANRWFPKIRSWIALGAPLELLSPLSIARIIALVAAVTWSVGLAVGAVTTTVGVLLLAASVLAVVLMMRLRALTETHGALLTVAAWTMTLLFVTASDSTHRVALMAPLVASLAFYAGLFLRGIRHVIGQLVGASVFMLAISGTHDGMAEGDGALLVVFGLVATGSIALMARTSRRAGLLDPDTGLENARGLEHRIAARSSRDELIIATVHLSGVAEVRDALGHGVGSELTRRAVEDLGQVLPVRARIGRDGDDILILLENDPSLATTTDALITTLQRQIEAAIGRGQYLVGDIEVTLNVHIGISTTGQNRPRSGERSDEPVSAGELLRQSALAARAARSDGRGLSRWNGEQTTLTATDLTILADLRTASERDELWLAFQPQVSARAGSVVAVEALLRWSSERHGVVPPGRFIPLAERTGLVDRLTDWVLAEALDAQRRWRAEGIDITVSVNVSPLSLRSPDFPDRVIACLRERDLPPEVLMLEVTESIAFDIPEAVERLEPLRECGVKISIDDFGTGYTSLAVLPELPLDELKVDQQFVRGATTSPASEAIVRSVCELGHRLGLAVVAEGVEDREIAELMAGFGYDLLQGYHFAKPMPEGQLIALLAEANDVPADGRILALAADGSTSARASASTWA